jgi:hypothetical protein
VYGPAALVCIILISDNLIGRMVMGTWQFLKVMQAPNDNMYVIFIYLCIRGIHHSYMYIASVLIAQIKDIFTSPKK